jgi:hypothetical protein
VVGIPCYDFCVVFLVVASFSFCVVMFVVVGRFKGGLRSSICGVFCGF